MKRVPKRKPRTCECGGKLKYAHDFGMTFVYCMSCTPVATLTLTGKRKPKEGK